MEIRHPSVQKRILVLFVLKDLMTTDYILSIIERILQSNEDFSFDERLGLTVIIVEAPMGGGTSRHKVSKTHIMNWDEWFQRHCGHGGCFIQVPN